MKDQIVILNGPKSGPEKFLIHLVSELRKSSLADAKAPIIAVNNDFEDEIPSELQELGVSFVSHSPTTNEAFENSDIKDAKTILILSRDADDPASDSTTFDLVCRARNENPNALIIAEAKTDGYKTRLAQAGADHVVRPMKNYPELLVRTILSPGTNAVIEDMFDSDGEETVRYNANIKGTWADVAMKTIVSDIGTPLAYIDNNGNIISNANPNDVIEGQAIIVLAREGNLKNSEEVAKLLSSYELPKIGQVSATPKGKEKSRLSTLFSFLGTRKGSAPPQEGAVPKPATTKVETVKPQKSKM